MQTCPKCGAKANFLKPSKFVCTNIQCSAPPVSVNWDLVVEHMGLTSVGEKRAHDRV